MTSTLPNRFTAALRLAERLWHLRGTDGLLMAVDRGGVPIGAVLARLLGFPLTLLPSMSRTENSGPAPERDKAEQTPETPAARPAVGINGIKCPLLTAAIAALRPGQILILVDDGSTTELLLTDVLEVARDQQPGLLVVAMLAASPAKRDRLRNIADAVICLMSPPPPLEAHEYYEALPPVTDEEVAAALQEANP